MYPALNFPQSQLFIFYLGKYYFRFTATSPSFCLISLVIFQTHLFSWCCSFFWKNPQWCLSRFKQKLSATAHPKCFPQPRLEPPAHGEDWELLNVLTLRQKKGLWAASQLLSQPLLWDCYLFPRTFPGTSQTSKKIQRNQKCFKGLRVWGYSQCSACPNYEDLQTHLQEHWLRQERDARSFTQQSTCFVILNQSQGSIICSCHSMKINYLLRTF